MSNNIVFNTANKPSAVRNFNFFIDQDDLQPRELGQAIQAVENFRIEVAKEPPAKAPYSYIVYQKQDNDFIALLVTKESQGENFDSKFYTISSDFKKVSFGASLPAEINNAVENLDALKNLNAYLNVLNHHCYFIGRKNVAE